MSFGGRPEVDDDAVGSLPERDVARLVRVDETIVAHASDALAIPLGLTRAVLVARDERELAQGLQPLAHERPAERREVAPRQRQDRQRLLAAGVRFENLSERRRSQRIRVALRLFAADEQTFDVTTGHSVRQPPRVRTIAG